MSDTFELVTTYGVKYTNKDPLPIDDIIASLKNYERLLKRTPAFIEKRYNGIKITSIEVFVENIESGSLKENFLIKYICKTPENAQAAEDLVNKLLQESDVVRTLVAVGIGSIVTYGVMSALPQNVPTTSITAYNNTIVTIGASVDLTADDIHAVLDGIKDKKQLAKEAVAVIKPTKADNNAEIEIEGITALNVPKEYVAEAPESYDPAPPAERIVPMSNVAIAIFASDRDNYEKGWAGIVTGVIDKRVKFTIAESVDPKKLHGRTNMMADIKITEAYVPSKKAYEAKSVEILKTN